VGHIFGADDALLASRLHRDPAEAEECRPRNAPAQFRNDFRAVVVARRFAGREKDARVGFGGDVPSLDDRLLLRPGYDRGVRRRVAAKAKKFKAVLEPLQDGLGWVVAWLPFDPAAAWKEMVRLRVTAEVGGELFRTSLFPGSGRRQREGHFLLVNKQMQRAAGAGVGALVEFAVAPDLQPRAAELPDELATLLDDEPGLRDWYDALTEYMRREIGKWVMAVKSDEARMSRAEQMAERLLATMEGERELPPVVEAAFRSRPKARAGWARMTPAQQRAGLMAVFYYQSPEARLKRVEKLCDEAEKHSAKADADPLRG